jgi:hypothetical protein
MGKVRTLFALTLALGVTSVCQAATLISTDFSKGDTKGWKLNGNNDQVKIVDVAGDSARPKALALTTDQGGETGTAWNELKTKVTSLSYIADIQIRHDDSLGCPADGVAMVFAPVETDAQGGGGGSLGLFGLDQFTAFEVNTWRGQGLGTDDEKNDGESCTKFMKHITFAFDVINANTESDRTSGGGTPDAGGPKIGQVLPPTGMKIVNGGFYRYQWNVAENGDMAVYVTGLSDSNKQFQKVKVLEAKGVKNGINFEGRFGLSAATGGAFQFTEIARVQVDSPMIDPQ